MPTYRVLLTRHAIGHQEAHLRVEADSEAEASQQALQDVWDPDWQFTTYEGEPPLVVAVVPCDEPDEECTAGLPGSLQATQVEPSVPWPVPGAAPGRFPIAPVDDGAAEVIDLMKALRTSLDNHRMNSTTVEAS